MEKGLSGLADILWAQKTEKTLEEEAQAYLSEEKGVATVEEAIQGACDILAERFSDCTLLCSHNNPIWEGSALTEIADAFGKVLSGEVVGEHDPKTEGDNIFYHFGDFGIVLTRQAAQLYGAAYE